MNDLYLLCRKIHRFSIFLVIPLGLTMMASGLLLKQSLENEPNEFLAGYLTPDLLIWIRLIHRSLSTPFAIILAVMMLTGGFMYLFPWLNRKTKKENASQNHNLS